jgi:nucleotide-binding universal stress UspA family protein
MNTSILAANYREAETAPQRSSFSGMIRSAVTAETWPQLASLRLRTILVPFDFSNVATALLYRLARLADACHATVHVLHVIEPLGGFAATGGAPVYPGARAAAARLQIKEWVAQTFPERDSITTTVRVGRAADEIVTHAHALAADLIVMSAHVGRGRKNVLVRTTTERVVRQSSCPVLVVGRDQIEEFPTEATAFPLPGWKHILVPLELSADDREALAYAAAIARENGAKLHLLHCVNGFQAKAGDSGAEDRVAAWLDAEVRWPVEYEASVWTDVPLLNAILQEARLSKIDLIVLPARDCGWLRRHRLWSITDGILRHAPCPVLSVNAVGKPGGGLV